MIPFQGNNPQKLDQILHMLKLITLQKELLLTYPDLTLHLFVSKPLQIQLCHKLLIEPSDFVLRFYFLLIVLIIKKKIKTFIF
jgi:hypothetical protein